jgi:hypothetical protein
MEIYIILFLRPRPFLAPRVYFPMLYLLIFNYYYYYYFKTIVFLGSDITLLTEIWMN